MKKGFTGMGSSGIDLTAYGSNPDLNGIYRGYTSQFYINGVLQTATTNTDNGNQTYAWTSCNAAAGAATAKVTINPGGNPTYTQMSSGRNTITWTSAVQKYEWCWLWLRFGGLTTGIYVQDLNLVFGGVEYTPKEAVTAGLISNFVPMASVTGSYTFSTWTNIYDNTGTSGTGNYPSGLTMFLPITDVPCTGAAVTTNKAVTYSGDGWLVRKWSRDDVDITPLNPAL